MKGISKGVQGSILWVMLAMLALPLSGRAEETPSNSANQSQSQNAAVPSTAQPADAASQGSTTRDGYYVLQKGDDLTVKVFGMPELDETVKVRPDGRVSVVLLPDEQAAGLTTKEFEAVLTNSYKRYYREPRISVIVRNFANQKIYVGGEVGQPGIIALNGDMTALAAVLQAGGFRPTAKMNSVILVRNNGHNGATSQRLNLESVLHSGKNDVILQPFDVVYVPRSAIARVDKFVDQYIKQVLPANLSAGFSYLLGTTSVITAP